MKNLLFLVLVGLPVLGWGQFGEEQIITACYTCDIRNIDHADLDDDGDNDLIIASKEDKLSWYENDGSGTFPKIPKVVSENAVPAQEVTTGDIDQDGDLDILAFSWGQVLSWYENDGNGNFSDPIRITNLNTFYARLYLVDIDGDFDLDILVRTATHSINWYENDGQGSFIEQNILFDRLPLSSIFPADIDNDNDVDIVAEFSSRDEFVWFRNNGNGVFSEMLPINTPLEDFINPSFNDRIYLKDLNNDTYLDIISASATEKEIVYYLNSGNGDFLEKNVLARDFGHLNSIQIDDINGDGNNDIAYAPFDSATIVILFNDGNSQFTELHIDAVHTSEFLVVHLADINNDSNIEILSFGASSEIAWYKPEEDFKPTHISRQLYGPTDISVADLDGDNRIDIISASSKDGKIGWIANRELEIFSIPKTIANKEEASEVYSADLDGDGDQDIIGIAGTFNNICWYRNDGNGGFSIPINIGSENISDVPIQLVDFDNDGDKDILARTVANSTVYYRNNGLGEFTEQTLENINNHNISILAVADINNDSILDVIGYARNSRNLVWCANSGYGFFTDPLFINDENYRPISISVADFDLDNDVDILVGSSNTSEINWYKNNGFGQFSKQTFPSHFYIKNVHLADLDSDGDTDVLLANWPTNSITWHENDGLGNFSEASTIVEELRDVRSINSADLDNDGDLDVISASWGDNKIAWHENLSNNPRIFGVAFWDENENKFFDDAEIILRHFPIRINENAISTYTDAEGIYRFYLSNGTYQISVESDSCWQLTTDSVSYTVTIDSNNVTELNFGFQLASDYQHTQTRINSSPTRCGFEVPFTLSVENDGCVPSQGQYGIVLDDLVTLISTETEPDEVRGDTLFWNYEELIASQNDRVQLTLEIAGTDFIGDTIQLTGLSYIENAQGELELSSTYDYTSEIRCAYDPNDKLVYPNRAGEYDANYTLFEEQLEYTVRFQNTGNDTAFTVVIRDELDSNLDWTTFKPILASHPHETLLHSDGLVEFTFRNILLPDSTTNEPLSHGFVSYRISPKADLEENTTIENTANIFFDFNPPIETNTTQNVLVSELPKMTSTRKVEKQEEVQVYPNPFQENITFQMAKNGNYQLQLFDARGKLVKHTRMQTIHRLSTLDLAKGLYFYQIKNRVGRLVASGKVIHN